MVKLLEFLARIGESQAQYQIEKLTRMYPYLFSEQTEENTAAATPKPVKSSGNLKSLETRHSHTV